MSRSAPDLAERIAGLSPAKRELLEQKLRERGADALASELGPRREKRDIAPLSFGQQELYFLNQLEPGSPTYNNHRVFRMWGLLDVEALGRALDTIQDRHEVLRSVFVMDEGDSPVQVVRPRRTSSLSVLDLGGVAQGARDAEARRIAQEEAQRPFDLARGPLLRTTLLCFGEQEHVLIVILHQAVFDLWSADIFERELAALYEAYHEGRPSPLPALPIQYADFAVWQREQLRGKTLEEQLSYWKRRLEGAPAVLELPASRSRPSRRSFRGATETVSISRELAEAIRALGQREGATLFMTLLAAFQVVLLRHSGQEDIVVGSPVAGRNCSETEGLIGFFLNTLVLRTDLSGNPTFRELLGRVRGVAIEAYAHQDLPFGKLVEELNPQRDLSRALLFQVFINMHSVEAPRLRLGSVRVEQMEIPPVASVFDLTLYVAEEENGLRFSAVYDTDLFDASTIRWMLGQFRTLLEGIAADPDRRLSQLPVLTQAERIALSRQTNRVRPTNAFVEFGEGEIEQSITDRFQEQALRHSSRIAVTSRAHSWTYERLADEADRVARAILEHAGSGSTRIALLFEQDAPMIAAILGSLKAGKTYVPLDPTYPAERLDYMLQDCGAALILTNDPNLSLAHSLGEGRCPVASVDRLNGNTTSPSPAPTVEAETLAYILYTSGSTGRPKGVLQNHRNVLHFIRVYTNQLHICADDRLSLLASYSFDAAVMDIFGALLNGATLCMWNLKTQSVSGLAEWLASEEVTILHAVPTVFRAFASTLSDQQKIPKVRLVVLGGEEARRGDVDVYRRHFQNDCLFVNGLGPTESTIALQFFLDQHTEIQTSTVPVGFAVDDTEILLLDPGGRATELYGEIGIRSRYVALGYWGKPELTQAVFLPDPAGQARRIYRTGDLGRRLPDGAIQFLGRKGSRVKLRGHRIELGEIEETLVKHVSVREAVVVLREEIPGDQRLVAYLVSDSKQTPGIEDLRSFLQDKLPDFMIPSSIIWLDSLPLTPNGKLDRAALPLPGLRRPLFQRGSVSPRNAIEAKLVTIFERVLEVRPVGVTDNFFDLGGHSLLAVRLLTQIEKATGKRLPLSTLFKAQTVEEIAARLVNGGGLSAWSFLVAIQPGGSRPPFFCVHTIGGHALEYRELAHRLGADQPFYALQALGLDGKQPALTRVEAMAACYVKEIRQVQPTGPYSVGGYSFGGKVAFEMARQLRAAGQKVALVALIDSYNFPPPPSRTGSHAAVKDIGFLWRRLRWHAGVLGRLEPKAMLLYFRAKAVTAFRSVRAKSEAYFEPVRFPVQRAVRGVKAANRQASRRYHPGPYEGRVVLFRASDWRRTGRDDPYLGWGQVCSGGLEVIEVDGDHDGVIDEPQVRTLAHELAALLRGLGDCAAEAAQSEMGVAISSSR